MVSTQDVSFGMLWTKIIGERARWQPGDDDAPALTVQDDPPAIGMGLVAVWVEGDGPVLICNPTRGLAVLKRVAAGTAPESVRSALREAGVVVREEAEPRRDSVELPVDRMRR